MFSRSFSGLVISAVMVMAFSSVGCYQQAKNDDKQGDGKKDIARNGTKHDDWWCQEHGIPEHICSQCLPPDEVKKMFKDTGDWCKIHKDRALSQCFKCDPSKYKKFEDMYVAKYNKKPERPPEDEFKQ